MSLPDEEEKEEAKLESIDTAAKETINKLKLPDSLGKAIDKLVSLSNSEKPEDFFFLIESSLFEALKKNLAMMPSFKSKSFTQFVTKTLGERVLKAQAGVIEHFSKRKDIDSIMEQDIQMNMGDSDLQEHVMMLAKSLEVAEKESTLIDEVIKQSQNLKYISKLIKVDSQLKMTKQCESITNSFCSFLQKQISETYLSSINAAQL